MRMFDSISNWHGTLRFRTELGVPEPLQTPGRSRGLMSDACSSWRFPAVFAKNVAIATAGCQEIFVGDTHWTVDNL